jgi:hypothetical protein
MMNKKYVFLNADGLVVQIIAGALDADQQAQFLSDYRSLFGATSLVEIEVTETAWIGGTYVDGSFLPPAYFDAPEIIEGVFEELPPEPDIATIVERLEVIEQNLGIAPGAPE